MASTETSLLPRSKTVGRNRFDWLDALRGLAVCFMIEAHVFNSFATPGLFETAWFPVLSFLNGLVAPAFLWIAGFLAGPSALKVRTLSDLLKRLRRCGEIYALGALMHAPWWLWLDGQFTEASWRIFFHQNILQCMGLSLGVMYSLGYLLRSCPSWCLKTTFAALMVAVVGVSPWLSNLWEAHPWRSLLVSESTGSLFPLMPWIAFAFAGATFSHFAWHLPAWQKSLFGALMIWIGLEAMPSEFAKAHPSFFLERLGYLLLLATAFEGLGRWRLPTWLKWSGQHSLGYYFWHLAALYFFPFGGMTLLARWGEKLSLLETALLYGGIMAFCTFMVWAQSWIHGKTQNAWSQLWKRNEA